MWADALIPVHRFVLCQPYLYPALALLRLCSPFWHSNEISYTLNNVVTKNASYAALETWGVQGRKKIPRTESTIQAFQEVGMHVNGQKLGRAAACCWELQSYRVMQDVAPFSLSFPRLEEAAVNEGQPEKGLHQGDRTCWSCPATLYRCLHLLGDSPGFLEPHRTEPTL